MRYMVVVACIAGDTDQPIGDGDLPELRAAAAELMRENAPFVAVTPWRWEVSFSVEAPDGLRVSQHAGLALERLARVGLPVWGICELLAMRKDRRDGGGTP